MNKYQRKDFRRLAVGVIVCSIVLLVALAACGQNVTNANPPGAANGSSTPTTQTTPSSTSVTGNGVASGCPSNIVMTSTPAKANVTIQEGMSGGNIVAHTGDIIEVRLPFGQKWSGPTASQGVLQIQDPAGYALKSERMCIWRFQAKGSGLTPLNFTARAICTPGKMCPMYVESVSFSVEVK